MTIEEFENNEKNFKKEHEEFIEKLPELRKKTRLIGVVLTMLCPPMSILYWLKALKIEEDRGDDLDHLLRDTLEKIIDIFKDKKVDDNTPEVN